MNVLFLSLIPIRDIKERGIYPDLLRQFQLHGHRLVIMFPNERRNKLQMPVVERDKVRYLQVRTLNIQKAGLIEKGISTLLMERLFLAALRKLGSDIRFDLVLYATPPITFTRVIEFVKRRDGARSYLLLKDIFPQNAVDLGMIKAGGLFHYYFQKKERKLYGISDWIGCMSPANRNYLLKHNKEIPESKVEVNPNSLEIRKPTVGLPNGLRSRYGIPASSIVFIYGGNLGKPQGISFLLKVLESNWNNDQAFFLLVGSGTEYIRVEHWFNVHKPKNALLIDSIPKDQFDHLLQSCDVGLIFLDGRFTIPNFPSRLLSYLENKMPVLAATDNATDIGSTIQNNGFGYWIETGDLGSFNKKLELLSASKQKRTEMGERGYRYMVEHFNVQDSYKKIIDRLTDV